MLKPTFARSSQSVDLMSCFFVFSPLICLYVRVSKCSSLPRSAGAKSSSLPASARSGLSAMLCVDGSAMERQADCPVQSIVHV